MSSTYDIKRSLKVVNDKTNRKSIFSCVECDFECLSYKSISKHLRFAHKIRLSTPHLDSRSGSSHPISRCIAQKLIDQDLFCRSCGRIYTDARYCQKHKDEWEASKLEFCMEVNIRRDSLVFDVVKDAQRPSLEDTKVRTKKLREEYHYKVPGTKKAKIDYTKDMCFDVPSVKNGLPFVVFVAKLGLVTELDIFIDTDDIVRSSQECSNFIQTYKSMQSAGNYEQLHKYFQDTISTLSSKCDQLIMDTYNAMLEQIEYYEQINALKCIGRMKACIRNGTILKCLPKSLTIKMNAYKFSKEWLIAFTEDVKRHFVFDVDEESDSSTYLEKSKEMCNSFEAYMKTTDGKFDVVIDCYCDLVVKSYESFETFVDEIMYGDITDLTFLEWTNGVGATKQETLSMLHRINEIETEKIE